MLRCDPGDIPMRGKARKMQGPGAFVPASYAFSHVIVDEAGQASEPECLCSLSGALAAASPSNLRTAVAPPGGVGAGRIVLAGDPHQLGPVLQSKEAADAGLGLSLLERLMTTRGGPHAKRDSPSDLHPLGFHPAFVAKLTHNYRSHGALIAVPNELFYDRALIAMAQTCKETGRRGPVQSPYNSPLSYLSHSNCQSPCALGRADSSCARNPRRFPASLSRRFR